MKIDEQKILEEFENMSPEKQEKVREQVNRLIKEDKQMKLPTGKIITFNDEQYEGIKKIREWLKNDNIFFTLSGYSGTGKSTIIKKILDENKRKRIVVSAPTHKAKKVVMKTTGQEGETLQSLLGLRPDVNLDDFNPNNPQFNQIADAKMSRYNLIIIDEASMINEDLFEMIKIEANNHFSVKILFIGDPAQIPPVHEKESVVFLNDSGVVDKYHLTQVMRQEDGNPLAIVYDNLRNSLTDLYGGIERKSALNSKGEGVIFTNKNREFREKLKEVFITPEYRNNPEYGKLIAWRNTTVMESNRIIREFIFGKDVPMLVVNDVLMAYRSVRDAKQFFNIIDNSEDYRVVNVSERYENEYKMWGYKVNLRETLIDGKYKYQKVFILDHLDHENLHHYAEMHDFLRDMGKLNKSKWKDYYAFRRNNLIMTTIDEYEDGSIRPNKEVIAKDLDYGYSITSHKAQGSTYEHVMILENDIDLNPKIKEKNQIKYVALTRPSKTATVFTRLVEN